MGFVSGNYFHHDSLSLPDKLLFGPKGDLLYLVLGSFSNLLVRRDLSVYPAQSVVDVHALHFILKKFYLL